MPLILKSRTYPLLTSSFTELNAIANRNSALPAQYSPPTGDNPSPTYSGHAFAVMIGNYRDTPPSSPWIHSACKNNNSRTSPDICGSCWRGSKKVQVIDYYARAICSKGWSRGVAED
ncbi:hypothetical protein HNY73_006977 [Argiope bruennichi]|uniref:Uncharacterized protein n=1 Tax=Argiope bruennichi TaxID=94029 RepID=A0A8T0FEZ6_ARGBR|nr:hypothetical protein HNY73_006977 [Argiope bruennichi]